MEKNIKTLAKKIYLTHKSAIDIILDHKPKIFSKLENELLKEGYITDEGTDKYFYFTTEQVDEITDEDSFWPMHITVKMANDNTFIIQLRIHNEQWQLNRSLMDAVLKFELLKPNKDNTIKKLNKTNQIIRKVKLEDLCEVCLQVGAKLIKIYREAEVAKE